MAAMTIIVDCSGGQWRRRQWHLCHRHQQRHQDGGRPPVAAAATDAATTTPLPLPPPSPLLQPLPMSSPLRRSCRWLVVVSSVAPCLLRPPPSIFVSPCRRAVVDVDDDRYCRCRQLPSPLPQLTTMISKSQRLLFVADGDDDNHCRLQRRSMAAAAAMTSLPPPSTVTTGWWPTARCCRRRQCRHHYALALASAVTIAAALPMSSPLQRSCQWLKR